MTPPSERREHVELPSTTEMSRRQVGAPTSGQLIRVMTSKDWQMDAAVWDEQDWERIPDTMRDLLLELKREFGKTGAGRFVVSMERRR